MKRDPLLEVELDVRAEIASSLGRAGRRLEQAVGALAAAEEWGGEAGRRALVDAAAEALWACVVQREAIGLTDHAGLGEAYGVTSEMWRRMGAAPA